MDARGNKPATIICYLAHILQYVIIGVQKFS